MWHKLCGVGILAMVPVEDLLLYSCTFLEKGRDGAGFTIETCISVIPNLQEQYAVHVRDFGILPMDYLFEVFRYANL